MERLFTGFALQGALAGLAACALFALAPRLQKRYGSRWLCRLWLVLAALFLLPMRLALPASWAPIQLPAAPAVLTAPLALPDPEGAAASGAPQTPAESALGSHEANASAGAFPPAAENAPFPKPPPLTQTQSPHVPARSPLTWAAWVWLAGAAGLCLWQFLASFSWKRHALRGALPPGAGWQQAFDTAFAASGLARRPRFLCTGAVRCPLVAGVLRPLVFVPPRMPAAGAGELMLTHELTHLKRRDLAFKALLLLVRAVHWYNPAAWLLARLAGRDLEAACDEQAVAGRGPAYRAAYCDALLCAVEMGRMPALSSCFALSKRDMMARFARLWAAPPRRRGLGALAALALCAALACGMVACSEGASLAKLPAAASAPTPSPSPVPDRSGEEEVWADLNVFPSYTVAGFPDGIPSYYADAYSALGGQRIGYAARTGAGAAVSFYSTRDGGKTLETSQYDLTPFLGQEPFQVSNYQMVSESTGFLVVRMGEGRQYQTDGDIVVFRTRDGGESWALMGRHACPQGARNGMWHTQPFLWVNENVGFWAPHTRYDRPDVWRTLDGGSHWEQLDLDAFLPYIPYQNIPGVHTCSIWLDSMLPASGHIVARCYACADNTNRDPFDLVSYDYGESWFLRDRYHLVYESGLTDESEPLYHDETLFSLPADPTDGEIAETALALLQQAYRLARLPADSTRPSVYQWENDHYARVLYPCAYFKTEEEYRAALARVYTQEYLAHYLELTGLFSGASPRYMTHNGSLYLADGPYWSAPEFHDLPVDSLVEWYQNGMLSAAVERQEGAFQLTFQTDGADHGAMTLRLENGGWRIEKLEANPS